MHAMRAGVGLGRSNFPSVGRGGACCCSSSATAPSPSRGPPRRVPRKVTEPEERLLLALVAQNFVSAEEAINGSSVLDKVRLTPSEWLAAALNTSSQPTTRGEAASLCNAALAVHERTADAAGALALLSAMDSSGIRPDLVSFSLTASACYAAGDPKRGLRVLADCGDWIHQAKGAAGRRPRPGRGVGLTLSVLFEDESVLAINKPAGVLVHPAGGGGGGGGAPDKRTVCDAALLLCGREGLSRINGSDRRGVVHRLDRGTSGCLVLAKTDAAHALLVAHFYQRRAKKRYVALLQGALAPPSAAAAAAGAPEGPAAGILRGLVDAPVDGLPAQTRWDVLRSGVGGGGGGGPHTLVAAEPKQGRKHQIRVHFAGLGNPLVGDDRYGAAPARSHALLAASGLSLPEGYHFLHAAELRLPHPLTGEAMELRAPLPPHFGFAAEWAGQGAGGGASDVDGGGTPRKDDAAC